jgi:glycerophosphoryl diester phosphodiesterase
MQILSHRGYWRLPEEKNTLIAFERSFRLGFGTETDIRDVQGELVISHDPPVGSPLRLEQLLDLYKAEGQDLPLALNIKADGLHKQLLEMLNTWNVTNYFVFDMSVPDALGYLKSGANVFTRQSEYEPQPSFYSEAVGVWIDGFHGEWYTKTDITSHIDAGKKVCLVSPDLHHRPYEASWAEMATWSLPSDAEVSLCTDDPERAKECFCGKD